MKGTNLGEFEELVMLAIGVLHPKAYGVSIKDEITDRSGRSVTLSAVHASLHRLEEKGFLESEFGEASNKRGGKRKKYFFITAYGAKALEEVKELREQLWADMNKVALNNS
ncbi:PadR family transcriptional regulator [Fulvivirga lutea]|uniref:Helix-turn-helix transcriptional regulator n=1 Tax=Fulvivirga lutea TaxID=2810512 RepID=A0A974WEK7_9BACT|nr:helix-turn-helix transcriptional regulator [Fulvivirga lutea]QSE96928.1 helix-turn-helix transcriptional regulator [Fulvivirga lutea]